MLRTTKRALALALLLFSLYTPLLQAQWRVTPEVGVRHYMESMEGIERYTPQVGAMASRVFGQRDRGLGVQLGIYYYKRKIDTPYNPLGWAGVPDVLLQWSKKEENLLAAPIRLQYLFRPAPSVVLSVAAGAYVGFGLTRDYIQKYGNEDNTKYIIVETKDNYGGTNSSFLDRLDIGSSVRMAVEVYGVSCSFAYDQSARDPFSSLGRGISFSLGYTINL